MDSRMLFHMLGDVTKCMASNQAPQYTSYCVFFSDIGYFTVYLFYKSIIFTIAVTRCSFLETSPFHFYDWRT